MGSIFFTAAGVAPPPAGCHKTIKSKEGWGMGGVWWEMEKTTPSNPEIPQTPPSFPSKRRKPDPWHAPPPTRHSILADRKQVMGQSHPPPCGRKEESHGGVLSYKSWVGGEEEPNPTPPLSQPYFPQYQTKNPPPLPEKFFLLLGFGGGIWVGVSWSWGWGIKGMM